MSIINTFDNDSEEIINPEKVIKKVEGFPETLITAFSREFTDLLMSEYEMQQISYMVGGSVIPIYKFKYAEKEIGFYQTLLGGSASSALLEEIIAKGGKNILFFGSCGTLNRNITSGHLIIPTSAYRDEGTSYHYAVVSDYIEVKTADKLSKIFDKIGVPYHKSKTWTTDSFYRETKNNMNTRKNDGCAVVEMECASIMAVGQFRGVQVYQFLYAADCLDGDDWDARILVETPCDIFQKILFVALEAAVNL